MGVRGGRAQRGRCPRIPLSAKKKGAPKMELLFFVRRTGPSHPTDGGSYLDPNWVKLLVVEHFMRKKLHNSKKCITFAPLCTWCGHYILKVFSLSFKKMWKFSRTKDERMTLITCMLMAENTLFINVSYPHNIQVWGLASFILVRVIPQPSC